MQHLLSRSITGKKGHDLQAKRENMRRLIERERRKGRMKQYISLPYSLSEKRKRTKSFTLS